MEPQKSIRQSNFELLRIFAIFLVIYTHYALYFNGMEEAQGLGISDFLTQMLFVVSKSCVNLFLVLSGYFMVKMDMRRLKWGKVLTLLALASFYISHWSRSSLRSFACRPESGALLRPLRLTFIVG